MNESLLAPPVAQQLISQITDSPVLEVQHLSNTNLGLLSISTASFQLLLSWFIGQTLELTLAGAIIGSGLAGTRLRRLLGGVLIFIVLSVITTVILQSLGVVPTTRVS